MNLATLKKANKIQKSIAHLSFFIEPNQDRKFNYSVLLEQMHNSDEQDIIYPIKDEELNRELKKFITEFAKNKISNLKKELQDL